MTVLTRLACIAFARTLRSLAFVLGLILLATLAFNLLSVFTQPAIRWESTSATVVRRETSAFSDSAPEGTILSCPVVRFTVAGQQYEEQSKPCAKKRPPCKDSMRRRCPRDPRFDRGQTVTLWYNRANPHHHVIADVAPKQSKLTDAFNVIPLLGVPIGILLLGAKALKKAAKRSQLSQP